MANASSDAHIIILSYITEHLISFYPLGDFKVHIAIGQSGFQQYYNCCIDFFMNDTKNIKVISSENKHIRVILLYATRSRLRDLKIAPHGRRASLDISFKV